jgi:nickel/cobalt transporter (NicO) family protein
VPSPSALIVLLGAIALGRTWFGVGLVIGYGLGMAVTLIVAGLLLVRLRDRVDALLVDRRGALLTRVGALLPLLTAGLVILVGVGLMLNEISRIGR